MHTRLSIRLIWLALICGLLLSCTPRPPETESLSFQAFGTLVDVTLYPAGQYDLMLLESRLGAELDQMHTRWHAWEDSPLQVLNEALQRGEPAQAPEDLLTLIHRAQSLEQDSDGLFNAAIGELIAAWGFHQSEPAGPPPDPAFLETWRADPPRMAAITQLDDGRLQGQHPRLHLDFGGLAKGLALQRGQEILQELGVEHAILNAGGDLVTLGQPPHRAWRIGIRDPLPLGAGVLAGVPLGPQQALFSSGNYERGYTWNERWIHHVLDPRTGEPSSGVIAATVLHTDPLLADAAATTLMLAGAQDWPLYAERWNLTHALVVFEDGRVAITPALAEIIEWQREVDVEISKQ